MADALLCHTYNGITPFNIGKLTIREYRVYVVQAFNLKNFDINGKLEYETPAEKRGRIKKEYLDMKAKHNG